MQPSFLFLLSPTRPSVTFETPLDTISSIEQSGLRRALQGADEASPIEAPRSVSSNEACRVWTTV